MAIRIDESSVDEALKLEDIESLFQHGAPGYTFALANAPQDVARATYAHYNAGSHWRKYQTNPKGEVAKHVADWMKHYQRFGGQ